MSSMSENFQHTFLDNARKRVTPIPNALCHAILQFSTAKTDKSLNKKFSTSINASIKVTEGSRNSTAFKMSCDLIKMGFSKNALIEAMKTFNRNQMNPPLSEVELDSVVKSALKTVIQSQIEGCPNENLVDYYTSIYSWQSLKTLGRNEKVAMPFNRDMTPKVILDYAEAVTNGLQVSLEAAIKIAIAALSGVIGKRYQIRPKPDFLVIPNVSCLIIANPSALKSPLMKAMTAPIYEIEQQLAEKNQKKWEEFTGKRERLKIEETELHRELKKSDLSPARRIEVTNRIIEIRLLQEKLPIQERLYVSDVTTEKMMELFQMNPYGLLILWDEIAGLFAIFEKQGREADRKLFLSSMSGDLPHTQDRIGRGTIIAHHMLSTVIGGIQPEVLKSYMYDSLVKGSGEDGFLQRFPLVAYLDLQPDYHLTNQRMSSEVLNAYNSIFEKLLAGDERNFSGDSEFQILEKNPKTINFHEFAFDEEAQELFNLWFVKLERRLRSESFISPAFDSHMGKFRKLFPSLALIFFLTENPTKAARGGKTQVPIKYAKMANWWCDYLEKQAFRLYSTYLSTKESAATALIKKVQEGYITSGTTVREVIRCKWMGLTDPTLVREALHVLEEHNYLLVREIREKAGRGSPTIFINPASLKPDKEQKVEKRE